MYSDQSHKEPLIKLNAMELRTLGKHYGLVQMENEPLESFRKRILRAHNNSKRVNLVI